MVHRCVSAASLSGVKALVSVAVLAASVWAGANDVIFTKPVAGSVHHVGDTMRIEFRLADTSVSICRDMMGFTSDGGLNWLFLNLFMNCTDTISAKKHYDWIIPDSVTNSRNKREIVSTVGVECAISIHDYEPISMRGQSAMFTIEPRVSVTSPRRRSRSLQTAEGSSLHLGTPQSLRSKAGASSFRVFSLNGREIAAPDHMRRAGAPGVLVLEHAPAR